MEDAERGLRRAGRERSKWLDEGRWRTSFKGNPTRKTREGFTVTVFLNAATGYVYSITHREARRTHFSEPFETQEAAMLGALDCITGLRLQLATLTAPKPFLARYCR
jgi:hypothetical protein